MSNFKMAKKIRQEILIKQMTKTKEKKYLKKEFLEDMASLVSIFICFEPNSWKCVNILLTFVCQVFVSKCWLNVYSGNLSVDILKHHRVDIGLRFSVTFQSGHVIFKTVLSLCILNVFQSILSSFYLSILVGLFIILSLPLSTNRSIDQPLIFLIFPVCWDRITFF